VGRSLLILKLNQMVIAAVLCCTSLCAQNAGKAEKTADQKPAESRTKCHGPIEILSDIKGVKFEHYKG
jgi:hypothetical protein